MVEEVTGIGNPDPAAVPIAPRPNRRAASVRRCPRGPGAGVVLTQSPESAPQDVHFHAFFEAVHTGKTNVPGGLDMGVTGALTSIMGREAIYRKKVMTWSEMGVDI